MVQFLAWVTMAAASSRPYPYEWLTKEQTRREMFRYNMMDMNRKMNKDMKTTKKMGNIKVTDEEKQKRDGQNEGEKKREKKSILPTASWQFQFSPV